MYADRIEVINPSGLYGMVPVDTIGRHGASSSRNQYLSRILESSPYPSGYPARGYVVENKGTGFAQIQVTLRGRGMAPAVPEDGLSPFVVTMKKGRLGVSASAPMLGSGTTGRRMVGAGVLRQDGCKGRSSRYELA